MYNERKTVVMIAVILIVLGGLVFIGVMTALDWDFKRLGTQKYETNTHEITEDFSGISVSTKTANIVFLPSEDGTCRVVCHEKIRMKHTVSVSNGTLTVKVNDTRKWYHHIGFDFDTPKITVYLSEAEYGALAVRTSTGNISVPSGFTFEMIDLKGSTGDVRCGASASGAVSLKLSTGDIRLEGVCAASLSLSVSTGKVNLSAVTCEGEAKISASTGDATVNGLSCEKLTAEADTGDITLKNVIASGAFDIETDTGNVRFERCDAAEIFAKTDTGNVKGSFLTDKIVFAKSDTGKIDVPKLTVGGRCEIETDTGDIKISIVEN